VPKHERTDRGLCHVQVNPRLTAGRLDLEHADYCW
jgi:hypothetical protein